jgi:hypothetical protein
MTTSRLFRNQNNTIMRRQQQRGATAMARIFDTFPALHQYVKAARYKVHKPGCDCGKVVKLGLEPPYDRHGFIILPETPNSRQRNLYYHPFPMMSVLPGAAGGGTTKSNAERIVEAEWQLRRTLFPPQSVSPTTTAAAAPPAMTVRAAPTETVRVAENSKFQIYDDNDDTSGTTTNTASRAAVANEIIKFKISCAACLLAVQPNGFVGICSTRRTLVEYVRDQARLESSNDGSQPGGLHHDHAIDAVVLAASELRALLTAARTTPEQSAEAKKQLWASLRQESSRLEKVLEQYRANQVVTMDLEIGHHLKIMLGLMEDRENKGDDDKKEEEETYWFVMVQNDDDESDEQQGGSNTNNNNNQNHRVIKLDLPGGKRYLGETSLECAIRETREETSLRIHIDQQRQADDASSWTVLDILTHEKEPSNHYYRLQPPQAALSDHGETATRQGGVDNIVNAMADLQVSSNR